MEKFVGLGRYMLGTSLFGLVSGLGGEEEELGRRTDELPWGQVHLQLFVYLPKKLSLSTIFYLLLSYR